MIQDLNQD